MNNSYYPPTNEGRALWWENILSTDAQQALTSLGLSAAAKTSIQADAAMAIYIYRSAPQAYESYAQSMNGWGSTYLDAPDGTEAPIMPVQPAITAPPAAVKGGIEERRAAWVQTVKKTSGYDPAVQGVTLGIEMSGNNFDPTTYQAVIFGAMTTASATVTVKFRKAGGAIDAISLRGRKTGTTAWVELGRFMATPATLHIPLSVAGQPEEWELQGLAYIKDDAIGVPSQIITILVRG